MASQYHLLAFAGAVAVLASKKKKKRKRSSSSDAPLEVVEEGESGWEEGEEDPFEEEEPAEWGTDEGLITEVDLFEEIGRGEDVIEDEEVDVEVEPVPVSPAEVILGMEHPDGMAQLGKLYQIRQGDNLLTVAREALFGTRDPINDVKKRNAVLELAVRIDCSPWNQALYGAAPTALNPGHPAVQKGWSKVGVSFNPIYTDNRSRMIIGAPPSASSGHKFAYIYIPMINLDLLDMEDRVTTEGMNYPDSMDGIGHNMIDPPQEILRLNFDDIVSGEVGCELPEGDFRKNMEAS